MADREPPTAGDHVRRDPEDYFVSPAIALAVIQAASMSADDGKTRWVFVVDDGESGPRDTVCFVATKKYGLSDRRWADWLANEYAGGGWRTVSMPVEIRPGDGLMMWSEDSPPDDAWEDEESTFRDRLKNFDWGEDHT